MAYIGIDGVHCTIVFKKQITVIEQIDKNLKNSDGTTYGNVKTRGEQTKLRFNLPLMLREDNVIPFNINDEEQISYIKTKLLIDLNKIFGDKIKMIVPNAIEVNVTKELKQSKTYEIIRMLKLSFLDKNKQTLIWQNKGDGINYEKDTGMLSSTKQNEYRLKVYDKTQQMKTEKEIDIKENTLRLELILQGRAIRRTYGKNCGIFDILDDIKPLIRLFRKIINKDIHKKVRRFLTETKNMMFEELTQGEKPRDVFAKYRSLIIDSKQVERTMDRYYIFTGKQKQSKSISKVLSKKLKINSGIIKEFSEILKK